MPADVPTTGPNVSGPAERPPVEPILATQHSAAGAKAFAEFFIRTIDWGFATMSGAYIRHFSAPECDSCASLANGIDKDRRAGDRYIGGRTTVRSSRVLAHPVASGAQITVSVVVDVQAFEQMAHGGKPVTAEGAHHGETFEVSLRGVSSGWQVVKLGLNP